MSRVALNEVIFKGTGTVRFASNQAVYVYKRGTTEQVTLYSTEAGGTTLTQPLTTDADGRPRKEGFTAWVEPGSYDLKAGTETVAWDPASGAESAKIAVLREAPLNLKDQGAKGDGTTEDTIAISAVFALCETAGSGEIYAPPGTYLAKGLELPDKVTIQGAGKKGSTFKLPASANTWVLRSKRYGTAGTTGGVEFPTFRDIGFDGNKANNVGNTSPVVDLDSISPTFDSVQIQNGYINLRTIMSRTESSSTRLEDGRFDNVGLLGSEAYNWYFEGPHDSQVKGLLAQTNAGVNISVNTKSEWHKCHAYGNANYAWELHAGSLLGCQGEGAKLAQCILLLDGLVLRACHFFAAGAEDGKVGVKFGNAEHTAFSCRLEGIDIEGCTNGAYDFTSQNGAGSRVSGWITQESGERIKGTPAASIMWDVSWGGAGTTRGGTPEVWSQASAETITLPVNKVFFGHPMFMSLTGTAEVKTISALMPGQTLYVKFASTAKLVDNTGNLRLIETLTGAENKLVQLVCDGTNWFQVAPVAAN